MTTNNQITNNSWINTLIYIWAVIFWVGVAVGAYLLFK